jgi:hypothetical protein
LKAIGSVAAEIMVGTEGQKDTQQERLYKPYYRLANKLREPTR